MYQVSATAAQGENASSSGLEATKESAPAAPELDAEKIDYCLPSKLDLKIGDVIKVQTNMGWEMVTVKATRKSGKLDIQFGDGEYMRSVLPRIFRDPTHGAIQSRDGISSAAEVAVASPAASIAKGLNCSPSSRKSAEGAKRDSAANGAKDSSPKATGQIRPTSLFGEVEPVIGGGYAVAEQHCRRDSAKVEDKPDGVMPPLLVNGRSGSRKDAPGSSGNLPSTAPADCMLAVAGAPGAPPGDAAAHQNGFLAARLQNQLQELVNVRPLITRRDTDCAVGAKKMFPSPDRQCYRRHTSVGER
eukprot:TRINITY_DN18614_c1_g3_i1.p1 TRINITY_DN18614_c1_g3~~TRINITY_DN18614_c1_g3_i1.p1  ORF type:complete len:302 (-),score=49.12 TRINITY_DN18614_c1_g3_i1:52-957(-)